jgi:predicted RNA-binding protein with PIN domain
MSYLIDGHNLIPKLGLHLDSPDDEMELIAILQEFARLSRHPVEVYFDGAPVQQARTQKFGRATAHFVRLGRTADSAIQEHLQKLGAAARNWIVVSSDREVHGAAARVHAGWISSDVFAARLRQTRPRGPQEAGERNLSAAEVEEWLKVFGRKN